MAVTDQQKLDFLLKKIGYTKTKTGSVVGTGAISGTPKQPFAEAIPSPLIIANGALWNESDQIPTTPPTSDTTQIKVYLAATSGLRMTADATSSGQRAYIAYSTYNNTSSARLTNWIDTQFGASYLIKVFKGDPNSGGVALSAAGSGQNDGWFFDYSAGVLNFNDTNVPSGVTDTNIYIVGYRYIGLTGAPTPTGGGNFTFNDLVVSRNLSVGGLSTFQNNLHLLDDDKILIGGTTGNHDGLEIYHDGNHSRIVDSGTGNLFIHGTNTQFLNAAGSETIAKFTENGSVELRFNNLIKFNTTNTGINVTGDGVYSGDISAVDATFSGNVSIGGTLTYEDVTNVDSVGLLTARSGIRVTGGVIEALAGENKIPSLYSNMGALPSAGTYHGMFAHVHATGRGYFAHAGNWLELVNKETNGTVGTGTETYNIGSLTATAIDLNGDIDVDGHTNLDNVSITGILTATDLDIDGHTNLDNVSVAGITTFSGIIDAVNTPASIRVAQDIQHKGDADTKITFTDNQIDFQTGGSSRLYANNFALYVKSGFPLAFLASSGASPNIKSGGTNNQDLLLTSGTGNPTRIHIKSDGNIGIGTDNPSEILHIANSGNPKILIEDTDSDNQVGIRFKTTNYNWIAGVHGGIDSFKISHSTAFGSNDFFVINGAGNVSIIKDLDVDGHTNLDNVSIAGVTSVASLTSGRVVTVGTGGKLEDSANLTFDGNDLFVRGINIIGGGATSVLGADIVTRNFKATGVSTFVGAAQFDSGIKAGGSTGNNGEYLQSTGSGLTWGSFPSLRTRQTFTASSGQTTFSFAYTIGFLDVYVNGIKLTDAEFTATNGTTTVLAVGCFVGDIVELVAYNTVSAGGGAYGIGNLVEDLSPQLGGDLDLFNKSITGTGNINITGVITATKFVGDGSGLTGITASGSGVIIKDSGSVVGTAATIDFGNNLSVSPISAGIVTITASGGGGGGVSGINTIGGVVNIANDLDVDGHTNLDNVSVSGIITAPNVDIDGGGSTLMTLKFQNNVTGSGSNDGAAVNYSTNSHGLFFSAYESQGHMIFQTAGNNLNNRSFIISNSGVITLQRNQENMLVATPNSDVKLYFDGNEKIRTTNTGAVVTGILTATDNLSVSDIRSDALTLKNAGGGASYATFSNGGKATLNWNNTKRLETDTNGVNIVGLLSATSLSGDGQGITNLPPSGHYAQDEGGAISSDPALVVNYVGAGVSATQSGSVCTVTVPAASGVSPQNLFETIAVAGQSNVVADSATDTLTFAAGSNMTITTNASNDTITFASSGGGGGGGVDVGITTNLSGTFSGGYGTASAINTYAYSSIDRVFEYTVLIERGSDFQTTKVLAKRSGTTVNATQYAVMYSNNLLAQLDVLIVSGEVRLYASPEPGVSGTLTYRIKREVM